MRDITLKELLEAGCHFGHQTNRWHPKAARYIYGAREGVHIIDLAQTRSGLIAAGEYLKDLARNGGSVVFVGTKRQSKSVVEEVANQIRESFPKDSGFYSLLTRWPGGLLTNFDVIKKNNLDTILQLTDDIAANRFVTKKEKLLAQRRLDKYQQIFGGLVGLTKLPDAVFFVDVKKNMLPVKEATRTGVIIVAVVDTNVDPTPVNYQIPANDDALGSIKILVEYLGEAWKEGRAEKSKDDEKKLKEAKKEEKQEAK